MTLKKPSSNSNFDASLTAVKSLDVADVPDVLLETIHFLREVQANVEVPEGVRAEAGRFINRQRQCVKAIGAAVNQLAEVA